MTARPTSGVRYALERTTVTPAQVLYQGFAHLPDADVALAVRVDLPGGAVHASLVQEAPGAGEGKPRGVDYVKVVTALVRAATKAEVAARQALPRTIVRWRG